VVQDTDLQAAREKIPQDTDPEVVAQVAPVQPILLIPELDLQGRAVVVMVDLVEQVQLQGLAPTLQVEVEAAHTDHGAMEAKVVVVAAA
jgi:hypothetical protein